MEQADPSTTISGKTAKLKTELASLLDGFSLKKPASVNAVLLWDYKAKHPTDLGVKKGERVKILYRNGDLAFVENSSKKQGFVPLYYCSLYRRRSSSLSDLSVETARKLSSAGDIDYTNEVRLEQTQQNNSGKDMSSEAVKTKRFGKMVSKGTYDVRNAENKGKKKNDKGIFNNAAKRLMRAFTSNKSKGKLNKIAAEKKPIPDWLMQLNFDNNNPDYSSSSDSSDDDDDSAYESFRPASEIRQPIMRRHGSESNNIGAMKRNSLMSTPDDYFQDREEIDRLTIPAEATREPSPREIAMGYANVRKLRTNSRSDGIGVSRSRSFNLDSKTRTLHRVLQRKPKDLVDESDSENELHENDMSNSNAIRRVPSHGCIQYENFVGSQHETLMVVLRDFITADSKDLNVLEGQQVRVLNKNDTDWWLCESENGRGGFVPREYLAPESRTGDYVEIEDGGFSRGRSDWQELSFRTKAASVKLARITPMAREPKLEQNGDDFVKNAKLIGWDKKENRIGVWADGIPDFKSEAFMGDCNVEECLECIAACSDYRGVTDGRSYANGLVNSLQCPVQQDGACGDSCKIERSDYSTTAPECLEIPSVRRLRLDTDNLPTEQHETRDVNSRDSSCTSKSENYEQQKSGVPYFRESEEESKTCGNNTVEMSSAQKSAKEEQQKSGAIYQASSGQCDVDRNDCLSRTTDLSCPSPSANDVQKKSDVEKCHATEEVEEISHQLPTYDEIMERRNLNGGLSEIKNRLVSQINTLHNEIEQKKARNPELVDKLLEEWRSEQKRNSDKLPTLERKASSDSQSTISDSLDSAPRVLRRRNSTNRRVRFQTPDNPKVIECKSETETVDENTDISKVPILATWL